MVRLKPCQRLSSVARRRRASGSSGHGSVKGKSGRPEDRGDSPRCRRSGASIATRQNPCDCGIADFGSAISCRCAAKEDTSTLTAKRTGSDSGCSKGDRRSGRRIETLSPAASTPGPLTGSIPYATLVQVLGLDVLSAVPTEFLKLGQMSPVLWPRGVGPVAAARRRE